MSISSDARELAARVAREERAAAMAKCESSRMAHLGLAQQYKQELLNRDATTATLHWL